MKRSEFIGKIGAAKAIGLRPISDMGPEERRHMLLNEFRSDPLERSYKPPPMDTTPLPGSGRYPPNISVREVLDAER